MEAELLENIKTFWKSAELVYQAQDYTSATILYFKCWFVILDYALFKKLRKTPKDHIERFRLLEAHFPQHYRIIDKYFGVYRDTYSLFIEKEKCNEVRKHVDALIKEQSIER